MPTTIDHRDLRRRHPLCPQCGYDLVATVAEGGRKRICPECGAAFDAEELVWERRRGDWNIATALRSAAWALGARALIGVVVAAAFSALAIGLTNMSAPCSFPFIVGIMEAWALGTVFSRRLIDDAGFDSIVLILAACLVAAVAVSIGHLAAAQWIITPRSNLASLHLIIATTGAWALILHQLVMERA